MLPYRRVWAAVAVLIVAIPVASSLHGCGDDDGTPCCAVCGDAVCGGDENNCNCPDDCASSMVCLAILPTCGDGRCESGASPGESHERCPEDCPANCRPCAPSPDPTRTPTSTATPTPFPPITPRETLGPTPTAPTTTPTPIVVELFELPGAYDVSGDVSASPE